jgi:pyruvate/2-oxoglutarate dehydrogenase complex dihydrolipoamide dehydrogenase (E3) component/uncharacterized membrane protein YdjX (TVP38/TMEM64 family)
LSIGGDEMTFPESLGLANPYKFGSQSGSARIAILIVIAVAVVAGLFFLPVKDYVVAMLEWTEGLGMWGPVVVVAFYVVACVLFLPGSVITLGAAFIFGLLLGFVTVSIGSTLGACAAFLVGRTIGRDWVSRKVQGSAKFAAIDQAVGKEGFKIVFLLRLSPVFPFNLLNYALGLTRVPFRHYALASWIGMIPGTLMYCYLGSAARSLTEVAAGQVVEGGLAGQILFWAGLVATIAVAVLITRIAGKSIKEAGLAAEDVAVPLGTGAEADATETTADKPLEIEPFDEHNRELVRNVHPSDWSNPEPIGRYNLVVIGAGTAGLVTAAGAAGLGARVALVERHLLGGDCLNVGCVPSKTLIRSSRVVAEMRTASDFGVNVPENIEVDFGKVMERMRRIRAGISHHDSAERFRDLGVDIFLGGARFSGADTVQVGGKTLRFKRAVIATGARAVQPKLEGLAEAGFLTNETVFSLTERPKRLGIIGAGPIGCEMAQAFQRLGSQVYLFHRNAHILDREDADAAEIVQQRFIKEGIELELSCNLKSVQSKNGEKIIHFETMGRTDSVAVDEILVGAGRAPNVEGLNLEGVGVKYDSRAGIVVNDNLQTTNPLIYAAGDICMAYKFTHAADAAARIVIQNTLFKGSKKLSALTVPWCTYTDPEIAHVGLYEKDCRDKGLEPVTFVRHLRDVDRAIADGEEEGFVKVHVRKGTDKILGATIVASHAGDMISEITVAMAGKMGLGAIANAIHPYPTQAEAIKQAGDAYNRTRLTPFVKSLFHKWLAWTR